MELDKMDIVRSILRFLHEEIQTNNFDLEQKESLEVAKQCLESTYEIDGNDSSVISDAVDLNTLFHVDSQITEEVSKQAEELKVHGNNFMKQGQYVEALDYYTRAIHLNPKNHVFYCNRAAAYSRLEKHGEAIADCKLSIKITPTAKAYGRLGVAYSNLKMYQEAKDAYAKAHALDPSNTTYEQNLKLADELLTSRGSGDMPTASAMPNNPLSFNNFINNPALLSMASQMISDPAFLNMTQQLAQQMQATNPNLIETLRQSINAQGTSPPDPNDGQRDEASDNQ